MKNALTLLAATPNYNRGDAAASKRIAEIYHLLKEGLSPETREALLREALILKKISPQEIEELLSSPIQLFCFPYAGGNKWIYENWQAHLPSSIQAVPIEYPGRGVKAKQKLASTLTDLLSHLESEIQPKDRFAFFGHSFGAIVAFELALRFEAKGLKPTALFLSGSPSPDVASSFSSISEQNDTDFVITLQTLGGVPPALLESREFKDFFLPVIRNDFALMNPYVQPKKRVSCPLFLFAGKKDPIAPPSDLKNWSLWTEKTAELHLMEGDHFFIHQPELILQQIAGHLCRS